MSARVFVHPRCMVDEAAQGLMQLALEVAYGLDKVAIGPVDDRGRREVVKLMLNQPYEGVTMLERLDGAVIAHRNPDAEPEAA